jgi:hypothetical protein
MSGEDYTFITYLKFITVAPQQSHTFQEKNN